MAANEQALYDALNDLVLTRFGAPPDGGLAFRFDRFGSVLTDGDFVVPGRPEDGYSPALAAETFAELVNRLPVDIGDGRDVTFTDGGVDETYYYRLLSPSVPSLPPTSDAVARQAALESFSRIKSDALLRWDKASLASVAGAAGDYRSSTATPRTWYDRTSSDGWSSYSADLPAAEAEAPALSWRLKLDDTVMRQVLGGTPVGEMGVAQLQSLVAAVRADAAPAVVASAETTMSGSEGGVALHDLAVTALPALSMGERVTAHRFLAERAPSLVADAPGGLSVSFEYCLVRIDRQWLLRPFLEQRDWYVPGETRGSSTRSDARGGIGLMPIAVLAVRNLRITAPWTDRDTAAAAVASDLGPFRVSGGIVDGAVTGTGLQICGWLLERMGDLPPRDAPGAAPAPREYVVVRGDSLWRIAAKVYGDGRRWPEIAARNQLPDPDRIEPGLRLVIP